MKKNVLIIGAGPAGLTAAYELLNRSDEFRVIIIEALGDVGGISRTIEYRGNRMDIGGHRFFSKSDWVMDWWRKRLPVAPETDNAGLSVMPASDTHMLIRPRLSRIYFLRQFFSYPISLSVETLSKLGLVRIVRIGFSYLVARVLPRTENNLEDFFINRFGRVLYRTFFKDYTEKVWGVNCDEISPKWGAQRIKGLSISKAVAHALRKMLGRGEHQVSQKKTETSLIERFLYPKYGPGQMWKTVAAEVLQRGGEIHFGQQVIGVEHDGQRIIAVSTQAPGQQVQRWECDFLISSMAIKDLFASLNPAPPEPARSLAADLRYRDFITLGLLVQKLRPRSDCNAHLNLLPDTWIYIQEPGVKLGRLQIFNNWCPALVKDPDTIWLGLEYFCQENDELWQMDDDEFARFASTELASIDLVDPADILDSHLVRVPKAYPAYFGSYDRFAEIQSYADTLSNLFLVGRNGMHRYNNQDHSMLTAKLAAEMIMSGKTDKQAIWSVNVEEEYHEARK